NSGDEIVTTEMEHHANMLSWQEFSREQGIILRYARITDDYKLDIAHVLSIITPRTKLVSVALSNHVLGGYPRAYIQKIITHSHSVGAAVLIDAAQSVGHESVNVQELGADFLVFSGHKMFAPTGVGVLYCA